MSWPSVPVTVSRCSHWWTQNGSDAGELSQKKILKNPKLHNLIKSCLLNHFLHLKIPELLRDPANGQSGIVPQGFLHIFLDSTTQVLDSTASNDDKVGMPEIARPSRDFSELFDLNLYQKSALFPFVSHFWPPKWTIFFFKKMGVKRGHKPKKCSKIL